MDKLWKPALMIAAIFATGWGGREFLERHFVSAAYAAELNVKLDALKQELQLEAVNRQIGERDAEARELRQWLRQHPDDDRAAWDLGEVDSHREALRMRQQVLEQELLRGD